MGRDNFEGQGYGPTCPMTPWRELCKNGWTNRNAVWVIHSGGPKEACIRWSPDTPFEGAIISGKDMPGHARWHYAMSCEKMAEPVDLLFGLWTRVGQRKHKFSRNHQRRIWLNSLSAAAMRPYVKLLWPLVAILLRLELLAIAWRAAWDVRWCLFSPLLWHFWLKKNFQFNALLGDG